MESQTKAVANEIPRDGGNERSTIEFPYSDLDNAIEIVRGVHSVGDGATCEYYQLAARMGLEAKGGGFRIRVTGAKTYGLLINERGGRITLTELGRQIIDPQYERAAKADAFLKVPLFARVFENYKGSQLPPPAALERAIVSFGVGPKVSKNARQVLMRSAQQGGYFELSQDRLTLPPNRLFALPEQQRKDESEQRGSDAGGGNGGGNGLNLDPLLLALLRKIPHRDEKWPADKRLRWFKTFAMNVSQVYDDEDQTPVEIEINMKGAGTTNSEQQK